MGYITREHAPNKLIKYHDFIDMYAALSVKNTIYLKCYLALNHPLKTERIRYQLRATNYELPATN